MSLHSSLPNSVAERRESHPVSPSPNLSLLLPRLANEQRASTGAIEVVEGILLILRFVCLNSEEEEGVCMRGLGKEGKIDSFFLVIWLLKWKWEYPEGERRDVDGG
ncbi:uncharacterized protein G2W53_012717 [Senna tora]|uniref:Uncharacterized protein n=1 Tax=Senna tora TaxID=362788 RepID=A0A834U422_9FABA|nr:uncharacterized protein G2W53_012717 [Senna tora]